MGEALSLGRKLLLGKVEYPARDAALLLTHVLNKPPEYPYLHPKDSMSDEDYQKYLALLKRREKKEPIAYLIGYREFMGLRFKVDSRVLIPRPETEILVETTLKLLENRVSKERMLIADVGCGSGAIGLSMLKIMPHLQAVLTDISSGALKLAQENAKILGVSSRATFLLGDLLNPLSQAGLRGKLNAIVSNPPYIPREDFPYLSEEVRCFEPRIALDGGYRGLEIISRLIREASGFVKAGGYLVLEIGFDQAEACKDIFYQNKQKWAKWWAVRDYAGRERVFVGKKR